MATEREAKERGYRFTGVYDWDKEKVKTRQKEFAGYKTLLVNVPSSKLSRSSRGMGYSVYIEPRYFRDREIERLKKVIALEDIRLAVAFEAYEKDVATIKADTLTAREELAKLESEEKK